MPKPASSAVLDTGHSLYSSLSAVWAFLEGSGATSADKKGSNDLTLISSGLWGTDSAGDVCFAPTSASTLNPATLTTQIDLTAGTTSYSIAWRAKQTANNDAGMVLGDPGGTNNYVWMRGGNYLAINANSTLRTDWTSVQPFTTEKDYVLTFEYIGGVSNLWRLYVNGSLSAEGAVSASGQFKFNTLAAGFSSGSLSLVGTLSYVYFWQGRALSGSDAVALHSDPYQIFLGSGSGSNSPSASGSASASASGSQSHSASASASGSVSASASGSQSGSESASLSQSGSQSGSPSASVSHSASASPSGSESGSASASLSGSASESGSISASASGSESGSSSGSASGSPSASPSHSPSHSPSGSESHSSSASTSMPEESAQDADIIPEAAIEIRPGDLVRQGDQELCIYRFNWDREHLSADALIETSAFIATPMNNPDAVALNIDATAIIDSQRRTWLRVTGGTVGTKYRITNRITTNETPIRGPERSFFLLIQQR